jgi:hypothetical protein
MPLTPSQRDAQLEAQAYSCPICTHTLANGCVMDENKRTLKTAFLCRSCATLIRKCYSQPKILVNALVYLGALDQKFYSENPFDPLDTY